LESLTALTNTGATESGVPLSAFSAPSAVSVVQSLSTATRVHGGEWGIWLAEDWPWIKVFRQSSPTLMTCYTINWTYKSPIPKARYAMGIAVLDGKIYSIGGFGGGSDYQNDTFVYDPATDIWMVKSPMPTTREYLGAAVVDGKIYAIGGDIYLTTPYATNEMYDPVTDSWTIKSPMPTPRWNMGVVSVDDKVYVIGGETYSGGVKINVNVNEVYDPATDSWATLAPRPVEGQCVAVALNGQIYTFGGGPQGAANYRYDPTANTWTARAPMPGNYCGNNAVVMNGKIYGGFMNRTFRYDPATDTWEDGTPTQVGRIEMGVTVVNDRVFTVGGQTWPGPNYVDTVEVGEVSSSSNRFLDLPFNYGDSPQAFVQALQDTWDDDKGRVDSWFDHKYPNYSKNGGLTLYDGKRCTKTPPYNSNLGCYERRCYDGHNGIDFARLSDDPQNPPIRPANRGVVTETATGCSDSCRYEYGCAACGVYGNYVIIDHQNGYFTRYAHLKEVYVSEGQSVTTDDTLGIMGATGNVSGGSGTHLHFSVYRDNGNGRWDCRGVEESQCVDKPVDPHGWKGAYADPWVTDLKGPISCRRGIWLYDPSVEPSFQGDQGMDITDTTGNVRVIVPPGAFSGQVTLELSPGPVAEPSAQLRRSGHSFWLRLLEWLPEGGGLQSVTALQSTTQFTLTKPITMTVTYTDTDVLHLDVNQLGLYHWDEERETWQPMTTTVDSDSHTVTAQAEDLGDFDLQAPLLCATDDLEPDDGYAAARWVWPNDWPLARGLDIPQDSDWMRFDAVQGARYTIRTQSLAGGADTVLNLYDVDALTLLVSNDDVNGGPASELIWTAPYTGTFFIETISAPGGATDCSATYGLTIATIPGDVIADCRVNIADIMQVASQWRCKCGDICYNTLYDLDRDCDVDIVDIMLVVKHWGESCG
jgi:murein DD-endopeptidase MepM/ murein hydrolase activator NlpD